MDIDGVIADARHRLWLIKSPPKDWDRFYELVSEDPLLEAGYNLAHSIRKENDAILYLSGRRESTRKDTVAWLQTNKLPVGSIVMRTDGDYRPASVLKLEILQGLAHDYIITVIVDDDPKVCNVLSGAGYNVVQAVWARADDA